MSSSRILFPQFRDEQSDSKYPFTDDSSLQPSNGLTPLQKEAIIDAVFYPIGGGEAVYLSQIVVNEISFRFVVLTVDPEVEITAQYDWSELPDSGQFSLTFSDAYDRPAGILLVAADRVKALSGWAPGTYTFTSSSAQFVSTTFIPAKEPGVRAIKTEQNDFLTGDVWLLGDAGVVLRTEDAHTVRVDIIGDALFRRRACADADKVFPPKRFLKTINGCPPDEHGNFTLTATDKHLPNSADDTVLRIYPTLSGVVIEAIGGGTA